MCSSILIINIITTSIFLSIVVISLKVANIHFISHVSTGMTTDLITFVITDMQP